METRPPHAFVSAGTLLESVSTDLYALSRGFIPGEIVIPSGMETRPTHVFVSAGTQVPPQPMEVRSSGLSCFEQGIYPRRNCDTVEYGNPTYELLVGRDSNPAVDVVGFRRRAWKPDPHMRLYRRGLPMSRFQPTCMP